MKRNHDKSSAHYSQSGHRAKRMVNMCINKDNGINPPSDSEDDLIRPEDLFGEDTGLDVLSSITRTMESLENNTIDFSDLQYFDTSTTVVNDPNRFTNSNESLIDHNCVENTEDYQLTELPVLTQNDCFNLLDEGLLQSESPCEDTNSQSSTGLSPFINNTLQRSPVMIPETPENLSTDSICSTSVDNNNLQKKTQRRTLKFPRLSNFEKIERNKKKYPFISNKCKDSGRRKCSQLLSDTDRKKVWERFWNLSPDCRLKWLARNIHLKQVARRTTGKESKKNTTRLFFLENKYGHSYQVCKTFLLNTLGYKNDSVITTITKKIQNCPLSITDKRGTNKKKKFDTKDIKEHIMRYKPCVAHYRRHNAPKTRYLNQDITLIQLYKDYTEQYPYSKCCIEIYRKTLKDMNISLHRPQSDKCFDCLNFQTLENEARAHKSVLSLKTLSENCIHKNKANQANLNYKADSQKNELNTKIYSMDLEKSLLIPMIPDVKDCFFTSRLIVFNLTFAGLQKNDPKTPAKCILWHEGTSGRDAKNIIDAIYKLLISERDTKHFIFWADNCTSQNKNWFLYTALVTIVNSICIDSITIKYLTKGHTHMSADGVHGNIEKNIRKTKNVYDFEDFAKCVSTSRRNTTAIEVTRGDIFEWNKKKRTVKKNDNNDGLKNFLLKDVVEVKFMKGERSFLYKKSFQDNYSNLDFLQKKYLVHELPQSKQSARGVHPSKKKEIIAKLVPLMPQSRQQFWHQLEENPSSLDLIDNEEVVD